MQDHRALESMVSLLKGWLAVVTLLAVLWMGAGGGTDGHGGHGHDGRAEEASATVGEGRAEEAPAASAVVGGGQAVEASALGGHRLWEEARRRRLGLFQRSLGLFQRRRLGLFQRSLDLFQRREFLWGSRERCRDRGML